MQIVNDLNIKKQAEELGVDVWHAPSFLFLVLGAIIVFAMTAIYYFSQRYNSPELLVITECLVVSALFIVGNLIIQGVEQLAKLNKMKSEFISVASHQLRTPLSAIRWETEFLLDKSNKGFTDRQKYGLENISTLAYRMTRLVNDLLDVARIDQNSMVLKRQKVNLTEIVSEIIGEIFSLAKAKNIRIIFDKNKKIPEIIGDPEKLKLAIENLLSNSIKYTLAHGKIAVNLSKNNGFVVVAIEDNGVGIPDSQQDQIFNKFFRSDNIIKYQTEGTGLGLYIAKSIIDKSGGRIWFQSKENIGTIFNFSLPIPDREKSN